MTENYPTGTTPPPVGGWPETDHDTAQPVKDQASDLANSSVQAGKHVGDVAREQASGVAAEAGRQGRNLLQQAQNQLHEQTAEGQQRIAQKLLSLSDEVRSMAENSSQGVAADVAQQAASRVRDAGHWLEKREPGQVVSEVQSFARRRPAVFLVLAAGAGLVAGRLTRGVKDASAADPTETAEPATVAGLGRQPTQPADVAGYPSYGEGVPAVTDVPVVTDDRAAYRNTL
jgi:hypothetical protein